MKKKGRLDTSLYGTLKDQLVMDKYIKICNVNILYKNARNNATRQGNDKTTEQKPRGLLFCEFGNSVATESSLYYLTQGLNSNFLCYEIHKFQCLSSDKRYSIILYS